jgi:MoaA/NifB/PqqE/SkfB family radical SAM enzyme
MALIHLFRRCDQRCAFCSYPAEAQKESGKAGLKSWLKEISEMGPGLVQISGGEPLLAGFADLVKLTAFCARTGRRVELQTNGVLFSRLGPDERALLAGAVTSARGYFNVNFPSHNAASDLKITRTRGAFAARTRAVKELLALGAEVRLTHVVSKLNYADAVKFAAFAAGNFKGASWLQFSFIKGIGRAEGPGLVPKYSEAAPCLLKALDLCGKKGLKCEVDHIPPCFLGRHWAKSVDIAKMRAGTPGPHLSEKKKVPQCRGCGFFKLCPGPRKDYIAVHGRL